jgi:predicted peroxiredoxin
MSNATRVIVGCSHGEQEPDRIIVAYLTAVAALDQGKEVVMWLTGDGVRLATDGYVAPIRADKEPPAQRLHEQFQQKGGTFYTCPICFNERGLDPGQLVDGAELKGATPLMEFAADGAMTFTY